MTGARLFPQRLVRHAIAAMLLAGAAPELAPAPAGAAPREAPRPAKPQPFTVAVLGDGFGEALAEGLRINLADQPGVAILEKTHAPFGLLQDAQFDWTVAAKNLFAGADRVDLAVVMLGIGDVQPIKDGTATAEFGAARWAQLYGDRVAALAALFRDRRVPLVWVGLPVVQDPDLSAALAALNEIVHDRAEKAGARYVDSWEAFVDDEGRYAAAGPDLNGRTARLRGSDGVDFTRAGERKLASFVESDIRQVRDRAAGPSADRSAVVLSEQPGFDNALQIDINAQIRREAGQPALPGLPAAPGLPGQDGSAAVGPVIAITAPVLATDGQLARTTEPLPAATGLVGRALVQGQPIAPKPGRMDDFAWPR